MIRYAKLSPGRGFEPGRALLYYAQRAVTLPRPRRVLSSMIAAGVRARHGPAGGRLLPDGVQALKDLRRDGLARLAPVADERTLSRMIDYFHRQPVTGPDGREVALGGAGAGANPAYSLQRVMQCPGMIELLNSERILRLTSAYLGCAPTLSSVGVRWSFPSTAPPSRTQSFHRDLDDWRFLKLFVYLSDVDAESGPHCFVRTSHRTGFGLTAKAYPQDSVEKRYGKEKVSMVVGPRGTTFVADTIGVHRGAVPTARPRLILQAQYSLLPVYAFHYEPVEGPPGTARFYLNRLVLRDDRAGAGAAASAWSSASAA